MPVRKKRQKRVKCECPVVILDGGNKILEGRTRDVSTAGFSAFLKEPDLHVIPGTVPSPTAVAAVRRKLVGKRFEAVLKEDGNETDPMSVTPVRVEASWREGFQIFVAFKIERASPADISLMERIVDSHEESIPVELQTDKEPLKRLKTGEADVVRITFPARHFYLKHVRNLCERLCIEAGFPEEDAERIGDALNEVLVNAFKHGCTEYGKDRIDLKLTFDEAGMFVCVRDPGGKPFDYRKYREFDKKFPESSRTGLHLVNKVADGWVVNTVAGKYTEVSFFKNFPQQ